MSTSIAEQCIAVHGEGKGKTSACISLASSLQFAEDEVARLARKASRNAATFAKYGEHLAKAKASRDHARAERDAHMAECPAAVARFGGAA